MANVMESDIRCQYPLAIADKLRPPIDDHLQTMRTPHIAILHEMLNDGLTSHNGNLMVEKQRVA